LNKDDSKKAINTLNGFKYKDRYLSVHYYSFKKVK
jgi:hypothetical protein